MTPFQQSVIARTLKLAYLSTCLDVGDIIEWSRINIRDNSCSFPDLPPELLHFRRRLLIELRQIASGFRSLDLQQVSRNCLTTGLTIDQFYLSNRTSFEKSIGTSSFNKSIFEIARKMTAIEFESPAGWAENLKDSLDDFFAGGCHFDGYHWLLYADAAEEGGRIAAASVIRKYCEKLSSLSPCGLIPFNSIGDSVAWESASKQFHLLNRWNFSKKSDRMIELLRRRENANCLQ